jgi:two-component system, chemotaxis family, CheB/CheR fusion protein
VSDPADRPGDAGVPPSTPASLNDITPIPEEMATRLREETRARLAAIIESSDDAIVSKTLDGVVRTWNKGAERIFGYTAEEMVGRSIQTIVPTDRAEEEPQILQRLRRGERVDHFETIRVRKDGSRIEVSVTISPIRSSDGTIIGASKIARDITPQKEFQRQLQQAKEVAEAASRAKDHFLSILSHELRTPLTPVLATLSLMEQRGNLSEELRSEIEMLRRNVEIEARLVDDLLDLTRISRGKVPLHFEVVDAHAVVRATLAMFQPEIDAKGLEAAVALRAKHYHVWADPGRMQQIVLNLVSNAIKFTPEGGSISVRSSSDERRRLRMEVRDTGIGIDADLLQKLFDPFEQGEQTTTRQFGGLGLGLSIARSLVEMHSGTITAASEGAGRGATFTLEFATVPADQAQQSQGTVEQKELTALRVLLLEDHEDTRMVMSRLLASFGCRVTATGTVRDALAIAEHERFDLLVSDIGLPDGSGTEVMKTLRARHGTKGIALSGFGQPEDLRRSREAGFDTHLIKPVNFKTLQELIQRVAG